MIALCRHATAAALYAVLSHLLPRNIRVLMRAWGSQVPLVWRAIVELGCVCTINPKVQSMHGRKLASEFAPRILLCVARGSMCTHGRDYVTTRCSLVFLPTPRVSYASPPKRECGAWHTPLLNTLLKCP